MSEPLRARLDRTRLEVPLARAEEVARRTLEAFPVRVWRSFLRNNGFLLSAGMSYSVLFAIFALLYIVFAGIGVWLGASTAAIDMAINLMNAFIPGLIGENGVLSAEEVAGIARGSTITGVLGVTGAVAGGVGLWTAVGAVTFTRRAVRDIFGLGFDSRAYWRLKARDLFAAIVFGTGMLLAAALSWIGAGGLRRVFELLDLSTDSWVFTITVSGISIGVAFVLDAAALAMLVRFLTGTSLRWRLILPGALVGGVAISVLQYGAGILLSRVPANPVLVPFAVLVGLLLWCRAVAVVVLVAASWIAVSAEDRDQPLILEDEVATRRAETEAIMLAARVHLRRAREELHDAPWYRRPWARRGLRDAEAALRAAVDDAEDAGVRSPF